MSGLDTTNFDLFAKKPKKTNPLQQLVSEETKSNDETIEVKKDEIANEKLEHTTEVSNTRSKPLAHVNDKYINNDKKIAKFETFKHVGVRITDEQELELKRIEQYIMRNRTKNKTERERITANSIIRCLIQSFIEVSDDLDLNEVHNEEILQVKIDKAFKRKVKAVQ